MSEGFELAEHDYRRGVPGRRGPRFVATSVPMLVDSGAAHVSVHRVFNLHNLQWAMACEAAVVASATGGIVDGETGLLVPLEQARGSIDPTDREALAAAFAERVDILIADPSLAQRVGEAGRRRAVESFAWPAVADRTGEVNERLAVRA